MPCDAEEYSPRRTWSARRKAGGVYNEDTALEEEFRQRLDRYFRLDAGRIGTRILFRLKIRVLFIIWRFTRRLNSLALLTWRGSKFIIYEMSIECDFRF